MQSIVKKIGGQEYRLGSIPAIIAKELLGAKNSDEFCFLRWISVDHNGSWLALDSEQVINSHVDTWERLTEIENEVYSYNFEFLKTWKPITLPAGMGASFIPVECSHMDPLFSSLIFNKLATYSELNTIYSLEDAFKLLEVLTVSKINEFFAYKESTK